MNAPWTGHHHRTHISPTRVSIKPSGPVFVMRGHQEKMPSSHRKLWERLDLSCCEVMVVISHPDTVFNKVYVSVHL